MTREKREDAIDIIQSMLDKYEEDECLVTEITIGDEDIKAFKMAIEALEQEPCEDAISREKAKQFLYERIDRLNDDELYDIFSKIIDDMYNELPSVTPQEPRWIPVSERLPKAEYGESDSVLVCFEDETQDVLYFNGSNWCYPTGETYISVNHKNGWHNKVVAWMPLPETYKAESEDKK